MHKAQGMILIASLIIMLLVSVLAIAVGKYTLGGQQQVAANYDKLKSYAAADAALSYAEIFIANRSTWQLLRWSDSAVTSQWWQTEANWTSAVGNHITAFTQYPATEGTAKYRIERYGLAPKDLEAGATKGKVIYRVTSLGKSVGESMTTMQSLYAVPN